MPIEMLHFLIIAIQKTATHAFVYYSRLYVASIMPINALIPFSGVRASTMNSAQRYQTDFSGLSTRLPPYLHTASDQILEVGTAWE